MVKHITMVKFSHRRRLNAFGSLGLPHPHSFLYVLFGYSLHLNIILDIFVSAS